MFLRAGGGAGAAVFWLVALCVAALAGVLSAEPVLRNRAPALAIPLTPFNGLSRESLADLKLRGDVAAQTTGVWKMRYSAADLAMARAALAREPTASRAARQIGLLMDAQGQHDKARRLVDASFQMNRRDQIGVAWLITDAARHERLARTLRLMDQALRVDTGARSVYLPVLAQALSQPDSLVLGTQLLRANPPWMGDFFLEAAKRQAGLGPIIDIRMALARSNNAALLARDIGLVAALQGSEEFGKAIEFVEWLAPSSAKAGGEMVRDPHFGRDPVYPPVDWQVVTDGEFGAVIDKPRGQLAISAVADVGGSVARQLVALAPGLYQLSVARSDVASGESSGGTGSGEGARGIPIVEVRCLTRQQSPAARLLAGRAEVRTDFAIGADGCRFFLLDVIAPRASEGYDVSIGRISLRRLSNRG